jgi:hypothetical protein
LTVVVDVEAGWVIITSVDDAASGDGSEKR